MTTDLADPIDTTAPLPKAHATSRHFGPGTFLTAAEIRELSTIEPHRLLVALACDFAVIGVTCFASGAIGHPIAYLCAVMMIGARLAGIGSIAMHDGAHHLLLKNRAWNDRLGSLLSLIVLAPLVVKFSEYRKSHFDHHRETNTQDDPDLHVTDGFYRSRVRTLATFFVCLSGIGFALVVFRFLVRNWKSNPIGVLSVLALITAVSAGCYYKVEAARLAFWYWIVPLATWGVLINQVRVFAEHYPENEYGRSDEFPEIFRTRDVINSWFDSLFVVTRGVNYHLSHHLCPQVPFYNLSKLQRRLASSPIYQEYAHVTHGYHRVLAEYFQAGTP